ncbi:MAG: type 4a pilus biogenesis protein PilO [Sulfurimonas sp.]|uniref:type 4a pilus biogenesis protein PilO n=1 Tax=Sulfurimonas sp. TaxID=2022749 RepID=UPI002616B0ED|nr:type 4a pilus biogenesis protein PilO [Sulfurimonas sp.]MCW8894262.1 type 4a pilus biogenesis protein PilO [Sulfurimonas sp.]MCW8953997.1 type 4a pilus biogenesis protein PilO [Sulfurimonas sp.]MCW9067660.1 type 4a pilus biogenesis protein PilO [Sulfurimonas sp.]
MNLKLIVEEYLQRIDSFFKSKTQKDVYMIYIMVIAGFSALAYPFYDLSFDEFNNAKDKVAKVTSQINADKTYLKANPQAKIEKLNREIKVLEGKLIVTKENNQYIKSKIETISSLIYDEVSWGEYLSSISVNAKKYNIKLINFTNKYAENNEAFGHMLDITLNVHGNYTNTLKFINSLEKSELVVDIHDLTIKAEDVLNTNLEISVWGITY